MVTIKNGKRLVLVGLALFLAGVAVGCGDNDGNKAVREAAGKGAASGANGGSAYGKVSNETSLPPQGRPPEPGTDRSKMGNAGRPAQ